LYYSHSLPTLYLFSEKWVAVEFAIWQYAKKMQLV
jgi:hypothetical protein